MEARVDSPLARLVRLAKHLRPPQGPKDFFCPVWTSLFPAEDSHFPSGYHVVFGIPSWFT